MALEASSSSSLLMQLEPYAGRRVLLDQGERALKKREEKINENLHVGVWK